MHYSNLFFYKYKIRFTKLYTICLKNIAIKIYVDKNEFKTKAAIK